MGCGNRASTYIDALSGRYRDQHELVALSDTNPGRTDYYRQQFINSGMTPPAAFDSPDLENVLRHQRVDCVIVTSPDFTHAEYVVRSLNAGVDVIVEKPLATTADDAKRIAAAAAKSSARVTVALNYRYSPRNTRLKQLILSGRIGAVTSVHFEWLLDTNHGADYFRRWHRDKANSGGLLVHKAAHHFDLINWWLDDSPVKVFASGGLRFYGAENAQSRGLGARPERGTHDGAHDPFELDIRDDPRMQAMFLDNEHYDGYLRDLDPFGPGISIEDNFSLVVEYSQGASLSYSLNAHSPWEGYRVGVNGTAGRVELEVVERDAVDVLERSGAHLDPSFSQGADDAEDVRNEHETLVLQQHWERARHISTGGNSGSHGGGDELMLADIFGERLPDPWGRRADVADGVRSIAVGLAGNRSIQTGEACRISDLDLDSDVRDV